MCVLQSRSVHHRRLVDRVGVELASQLGAHLGVDAAADLADVAQVLALVDGQDQRADVGVRALPGLVPDDDGLLFAPVLDLEP